MQGGGKVRVLSPNRVCGVLDGDEGIQNSMATEAGCWEFLGVQAATGPGRKEMPLDREAVPFKVRQILRQVHA